jgi:carbamoyltransferase
VAAAEEERFTRCKHDAGFPQQSIDFCLEAAGLRPEHLDYVGFYDKPLLKFERLLETYLAFAPLGFRSFVDVVPGWLRERLHVPRAIRRGLGSRFRRRVLFAEHHESHASSAFYPSPFDQSAILTFDGVGEWTTASIGTGQGNQVCLTHELRFPHSLGMLYSAFTAFCGFAVNDGEYKLMGLAPYGQSRYADLIRERLLDLKPDGSFRLNMRYFAFCAGSTMTSRAFAELFGGPPRSTHSEITQREMDLAASIQAVTEEIVLRAALHAHELTGMSNLCLAGGVALNSVANGRLLREGPFDKVWIQPAAGDSGGAIGVALLIWHQLLGQPRNVATPDAMRGSLLGPEFSSTEVEIFLARENVRYRKFDSDEELCDYVARHLEQGSAIGWFQGRMEFGPRALGSRSILADPRRPQMQAVLNEKIKQRESFRPFAPVVLGEQAHDYFDIPFGEQSPYMLFVVPVQEKHRQFGEHQDAAVRLALSASPRSTIPAVTHVDYSARVQTVTDSPRSVLRTLLERYYQRTGCPVLVNTSFNVRDEPIVCSPADALRCFHRSGLDLLVMDRFVVEKAAVSGANPDAAV